MKEITSDMVKQHCLNDEVNYESFLEKFLDSNFFPKLRSEKRLNLFFDFLHTYSFLIYGISEKGKLLLYEQSTEKIYSMTIHRNKFRLFYENTSKEFVHYKYWYINSRSYKTNKFTLTLILPENLISKINLQFEHCDINFDLDFTYHNINGKKSESIKDYFCMIKNINIISEEINKILFINLKHIVKVIKNLSNKLNINTQFDLALTKKNSNKPFFKSTTCNNYLRKLFYEHITYSCTLEGIEFFSTKGKISTEEFIYLNDIIEAYIKN